MGIIDNGLVVFVYIRINKIRSYGGKDHETHVRYFIPSLAVFDLATLICFFALPVADKSVWLCKGVAFVMFSAVRTSILILLLIAVQRFMLIALIPKRVLSVRQLRISLAVGTLIGTLATLPDLFLIDTTVIYINETNVRYINDSNASNTNETYKMEVINETVTDLHCGFRQFSRPRKAALTASLLLVLLVIATVSCLYAYILRILIIKLKLSNKNQGLRNNIGQHESLQETTQESELHEQKYEEYRGNENSDACGEFRNNKRNQQTVIGKANEIRNMQRQKAKLKFIVMFLIIMVFYGVSYIPYHIIRLVDTDLQNTDKHILSLLAFVNHIINPFIYGCFDSVFREKCRELFCRNRCK